MARLEIDLDFETLREGSGAVLHVLVRVQTEPAPEEATRRPMDLALVLDRSASMAADGKMNFAREAVRRVVESVGAEDRVALVAYDNLVDVLATPTSGADSETLFAALENLTPRGMTNLDEGWSAGLTLLEGLADPAPIRAVLLLTDGLANEGETRRPVLAERGRKQAEQGLRTSCFGFGDDFDEDLLTEIAESADGHFYYIDDARRAPEAFLAELSELSGVVARSAVVTMEIAEGLELERNYSKLAGREERRRVSWRLGDLVANDERTLLCSLRIAEDLDEGEWPAASVVLSSKDMETGAESRVETPVNFTVGGPADLIATRRATPIVLRERLVLGAAVAKDQAALFADQQAFAEARRSLDAAIHEIRRALKTAPTRFNPEDREALEQEIRLCEEIGRSLMPGGWDRTARKSALTQSYMARSQRGSWRRRGADLWS